ncbi:unnamed protein product [Trichobilharzia szidati]|nr:unnamed protein product [Trichobilharzia szidati]
MAYTMGDENFGFSSLLTIEVDGNSFNSAFHVLNGVELLLDSIPGDSNPANLPYELQDMQFYSPQILLLLVSRRSKHSKSQYLRSAKSNSKVDELDTEVAISRKTASDLMHSWLVMVPIRDILNTTAMNTSNNRGEEEVPRQTDTVASIVNESIQTNLPKRNISEFITRTNVEALPWHAIKLTTNGDRSIIFVLFENYSTCRVYLMERPESDETMTVDYPAGDENPTNPVGEDNTGTTITTTAGGGGGPSIPADDVDVAILFITEKKEASRSFTIFNTIVSSIQHTTCKEVSSEKNDDKTAASKTSSSPTSSPSTSPDYEFSFQSRAKSLHSNLQALSEYLKRIHQLTSVYCPIDSIERFNSYCHHHHHHNSNDDNRSKTIKEVNNKSQLISHRLTVHKLLSEELDHLKKIRTDELNRQKRLVEFSGNLATGVRSVTAAARGGSTGTNISAYLKPTSDLDDTTVVRRRGHQQKSVEISQQQEHHQQQEQKESQQQHRHDHDHDDDDGDTSLTDTELHTLKIENDELFEQLTREKDEIHQVAKKISEIGYLNQTLTEHLSEQLEKIEQIGSSSVTATEYIRQGNELLLEAINTKATVQFWMLFILIVLTLSLHFLDWFYP